MRDKDSFSSIPMPLRTASWIFDRLVLVVYLLLVLLVFPWVLRFADFIVIPYIKYFWWVVQQ